MNSFGRAVKVALQHRGTVVLAVVCSLGVAVLWGGNITAVYPLVAVVLEGDSAPEWLDQQIADSRERIRALEVESAAPTPAAGSAAGPRLRAEEKALERYLWLKPHLDRYAPTTAFGTLVIVCLLLLVGTLLKNVFRIAGQILVARLAHRTTRQLRKEFYRRTLRLDLASFNERGRGDLMTRFTTDMHFMTGGLQTLFGLAVREPLKMTACVVGAACVSWRLLLLTVPVALVAALAIRWLARALKRANRRALAELSGIYETLGETFAGMKVIKAFTMEPLESARFDQAAHSYYRKSMKIARYDSLSSPITESMGIAMIILAILAGGYLAIHEQTHLLGIYKISDRPLDAASLMLFYAFLAGVSDPARRLSHVFNLLQKAAAASERFYEMFDRQPQIRQVGNPRPLPKEARQLTFENVSFAYQPQQPVLQDIQLSVQAGEAIALVGPNGCGKSTLLSLVPRFFDPTAGRVTIEGMDLRHVCIRELRQRIGLVTQETLLFNDTVAANIRYGSPQATDQEVFAAAQQAHAHKFITEKLSNGYDTLVGPSGNRLSGGQRQRLALARAILRDPQILILDEATSQVDVQSEQLIHRVLAEFIQGRTTLIITHRPSTLALASRIAVMHKGRIEDVGTSAELSARCDLFGRLTHAQVRQTA